MINKTTYIDKTVLSVCKKGIIGSRTVTQFMEPATPSLRRGQPLNSFETTLCGDFIGEHLGILQIYNFNITKNYAIMKRETQKD